MFYLFETDGVLRVKKETPEGTAILAQGPKTVLMQSMFAVAEYHDGHYRIPTGDTGEFPGAIAADVLYRKARKITAKANVARLKKAVPAWSKLYWSTWRTFQQAQPQADDETRKAMIVETTAGRTDSHLKMTHAEFTRLKKKLDSYSQLDISPDSESQPLISSILARVPKSVRDPELWVQKVSERVTAKTAPWRTIPPASLLSVLRAIKSPPKF